MWSEAPIADARVLVVDDHDLFRNGLVQLLADEQVPVAAACRTAEEALDVSARSPVDLVLLDLRLPGMSGVDAVRELRAREAPPRIIMLTAHESEADLVACLSAGADGYLLKDTPPSEIVSAMAASLRGEAPLSPAVAVSLVRRLRKRGDVAAPAAPGLSPRELQVLEQLVDGASNADIARELFVSESTAKNHVAAIIAKLGATSRLEAAVKAVRLGLV